MKEKEVRKLRDIISCNDCYYGDTQCNKGSVCKKFQWIDESMFENKVMPILKERCLPCKETKLTRKCALSRMIEYYGETTLDEYYVDMINDTLKEIRHGKIGYVYNIQSVEEILRFEPEANVVLNDDTYCITLTK